MADETASFAIKLEDETSGPANSATAALGKLQEKIKADVRALSDMQSAMKRLQGGTTVNVQAFRELQSKIEKQKQKISESQAAFVGLGGQFGKTYRQAKEGGSGLKDFTEKLSRIPGPLGQVGGNLQRLAGGFPLVAIGAAAAAVGVVVFAAALISGAVALGRFGIASANARRNEALHLEAIAQLRGGMSGVRASAGEMQSAIDDVSASSATSRAKVAEFAEILQRGGLRGGDLQAALRAASTQAAALGDESGSAFARMAVSTARAGGSVRSLASDVQNRFGGIAARRMLDLDVLSNKLGESFSEIFGGLNLEPLLEAIHSITELFSQSTASGRALKAIVTALFQPLIGQASEAGPIIVAMFKGALIAALKFTIFVLQAKIAFKTAFGPSGLQGHLQIITAQLLNLVPIIGPALSLAAQARGAQNLQRGAAAATQTRTAGTQAGQLMVAGLAQGMRRNTEAVTAARELGRATTQGLRDELEIQSPSQVFAELGRQIPAGVALGIEAGSDKASSAAASVVDVPGVSGRGGRSGRSLSIGELHIHTQATDTDGIVSTLRTKLSELLEGVSIEMGAPA